MDGQTDFGTKLIYPFFLKKKAGIKSITDTYPWILANIVKYTLQIYPGIQFRLPCTPPGQFFIGAKLFIGTTWMGNEGVLKKNSVWAM